MHKHMREIIKAFTSKHILVVGDFMLDRYDLGRVTRISPEAPVPVFEYETSEYKAGGAGNTAMNLAALGAQVSVYGVVGCDENADIMKSLLKQYNINDKGIVHDASRPTTLKMRYIAQERHLFRVDHEKTHAITEDIEQRITTMLQEELKGADAVVVSDYTKGVFTPYLAECVRKGAGGKDLLIVADIKPRNKSLAQKYSVIKPNLKEGQEMTQKTVPEEIVVSLAKELDSSVLLTMGKQGMMAYDHRTGERNILGACAKEACDVTGAGDTVTAVLALAMASGATLCDAASLANLAAGIVVQKHGTATVTREELLIYNRAH